MTTSQSAAVTRAHTGYGCAGAAGRRVAGAATAGCAVCARSGGDVPIAGMGSAARARAASSGSTRTSSGLSGSEVTTLDSG